MGWLTHLAQTNWVFAAFIFILARAMAIIIPPIPGAVLDLPAVQIFGWKTAFVLSESGTMLGAMCAFSLARKLRDNKLGKFASRLFRIEKVHEWEQRLPRTDQFLAWIALRLPTNAAFDYISYAAGLTNCNTSMFFLSTLLGNVPVVFIFFYLAGTGFRYYNAMIGWLLPLAFVCLISLPMTLRLRRKLANTPPKKK